MNKILHRAGKRVLLFVDNCSVHPHHVELSDIELKFFLPNTPTEAQLMDQGIIQNLKVHYKCLLLRKQIKAIDYGIEFKYNILDALYLLSNAWDKGTHSTINGCFRKAEFVITQDLHQEINKLSQENELITSWETLKSAEALYAKITIEDYQMVDKNLITDGPMTLKDIAALITGISENQNDKDFAELEEPQIVSTRDAYQALITLRNF